MGSQGKSTGKVMSPALTGVALGFRASSIGALFFLFGYVLFQNPWWSVLPVLAGAVMIARWPARFSRPSLPVSLTAAVTAWVPLMYLFWERERRAKLSSWEPLASQAPDYGWMILGWLPLFTAAALCAALGMVLVGVATLPWWRGPRMSRAREAIGKSAAACLVVFFLLLLVRLGWDFSMMAALTLEAHG